MTIELISIIALAGLIIALFRWLKQDIRDSNNRIDKLSNEIKEQGHILGEIRQRLARLEGLIEGLFRSQPIIPSPDNPDEQNRAA